MIELDNQRVIEGMDHFQTLNNDMKRWKIWLKRFNGIGTDYYLNWFRTMEDNRECSDQTWLKKRYKMNSRLPTLNYDIAVFIQL